MPSFRPLLFAALVTATGCGSLTTSASDAGDRSDGVIATAGVSDTASNNTGPGDTAPNGTVTDQRGTVPATASPAPTSEFASRVTRLPSAIGVPDPSTAPTPVAMRYEAIGLAGAEVVPVGVEANGEMEVPEASRVGWYRFGPSPGEPGSAVLAAHIAFDGERGAFRDLGDAMAGHRFTIDFDDGSTSTYEVVERAQYEKNELPFDSVFAQSGPSVITLISCGGSFQPSLASYEDNIVAYAVAVD